MGFPIFEVPSWGPEYKVQGNPTIWGSILGAPYCRKPSYHSNGILGKRYVSAAVLDAGHHILAVLHLESKGQP